MRKAKAKKAGGASKKGDASSATAAPATEDTAAETPENKEKETSQQEEEEKKPEPAPEEDEPAPTSEATEAAAKSPTLSSGTTPSLAQQSKARSASFRQGTASAGPLSPLSPVGGSGNVLGLGLEGETAPDIYRKHVLRIEELEREKKALEKEVKDAEKRWQKAEKELEDLREGESERAGGEEEVEKLVSYLSPFVWVWLLSYGYWMAVLTTLNV
jgi:hypothetical protein